MFRFVSRIARGVRNVFSSLTPTGVSWNDFAKILGIGGKRASSGVRVGTKNTLGYPAVWRAVNLICDGNRKLGLHLYRKKSDGSRERQTLHPSYKLVRRKANSLLTSGVFRQVLTFHVVFWGNGYAAIIRNGRGQAKELLILDPSATYPVIANGKLWYVTTIAGELVRLRGEDVFHLRRLSRDGLNGYGLIDIFRESLGMGLAARKFGATFFGHGAKASGLLMIPSHVRPEAQRNLLDKWNKMATGLAKHHKVALIQDGAKFEQLTIPPEAAQFLQTRQFENREVSLIFGVPPHKLGDTSRTSYNSLEQEERAWLFDGLDPWLVMWEEECNDKLLTEEEKESDEFYFRFNREEALQMSFRERMEGIAKGFSTGRFTVNDQLRMDDQPTIGPSGDMRFRPANLVPLDYVPQAKPAPGAPPGGNDKPEIDDEQPDDGDDPQESTKREQRRARARAIKQAHYAAIRDRVSGAVRIEAREVIDASKRGGNFVEWLDAFYEKHRGRFRERVASALFAYHSLRGVKPPAADVLIDQFANTHCERQKSGILSATEVPAGELAESIAAHVATWEGGEAYRTLDDWALVNKIPIPETEKGELTDAA